MKEKCIVCNGTGYVKRKMKDLKCYDEPKEAMFANIKVYMFCSNCNGSGKAEWIDNIKPKDKQSTLSNFKFVHNLPEKIVKQFHLNCKHGWSIDDVCQLLYCNHIRRYVQNGIIKIVEIKFEEGTWRWYAKKHV